MNFSLVIYYLVGDKVEVIAPQSIRNIIFERAKKIQEKYRT